MESSFRITGLHYVSLYFSDVQAARAFYEQVLGPPGFVHESESTFGWDLGSSWLTIFPASAGPVPGAAACNAEFGVCVASAPEVDALTAVFVQAGAVERMKPHDTRMYVPMRFACVDDPFGIRIDIYCPLE